MSSLMLFIGDIMHEAKRQQLGRLLAEIITELKPAVRAFEKMAVSKQSGEAMMKFVLKTEQKLVLGYNKLFSAGTIPAGLKEKFIELQTMITSESKKLKRFTGGKQHHLDSLNLLRMILRKIDQMGASFIGYNWLKK